MRKYPIPAAIAAVRAAEARRSRPAAVPLYLPGFDERFAEMPPADGGDDGEVDASGVTVGGDEDDDFY